MRRKIGFIIAATAAILALGSPAMADVSLDVGDITVGDIANVGDVANVEDICVLNGWSLNDLLTLDVLGG